MAKIYFKLDTRRELQDGTYPVKIVVSHNSQTTTVSTGISLSGEQWSDFNKALEGKRRMRAAERYAAEQRTKMEAALQRLEDSGRVREMSAAELKDALLRMVSDKQAWYDPLLPGDAIRTAEDGLFVPFYTAHMESREKKSTRDIYAFTLKMIRRFEEQQGRDPERLRFEDITPQWLYGFEAWMSPTNGKNSISKNMRNIRSVFNAAIDDGVKADYPFSRSSSRRDRRASSGQRKYKIPVERHTPKRNLTLEQLITLRDYPCAPHQEKYRDMFMLMFYLIGINAADLFTARPRQLVDGRLEYDREKTGRAYSIKVEPEAMAIIEKYRGKEFLLSPCDRNVDYRNYLHRMNDQLKLIGVNYHTRERRSGVPLFPRLSSYWARHTWSSLAINNDIAKDIVGKALGHAWAVDSVTDIYINMDPKIIDRANRAVLDLLK